MKQLLSHSLNTCPNNMYMFDKALEFVFLSAEGQDAMTSCSASGPWWHWSGICSPWRRGTTLALITWLVGRRLTSTRSFLAITTGQPSLHTCFQSWCQSHVIRVVFSKNWHFLGLLFFIEHGQILGSRVRVGNRGSVGQLNRRKWWRMPLLSAFGRIKDGFLHPACYSLLYTSITNNLFPLC